MSQQENINNFFCSYPFRIIISVVLQVHAGVRLHRFWRVLAASYALGTWLCCVVFLQQNSHNMAHKDDDNFMMVHCIGKVKYRFQIKILR
jgi:hypothetical protein